MTEKDNQLLKGKWVDCKRAQPKEEIEPEPAPKEAKLSKAPAFTPGDASREISKS